MLVSCDNRSARRAGKGVEHQDERSDADERPKVLSHQRPTAAQATADVQMVIMRQNFLGQRPSPFAPGGEQR